MLVRNAVILGLLAPAALVESAVPLVLMLAGTTAVVLAHGRSTRAVTGDRAAEIAPGEREGDVPLPAMLSPFSFSAALRFGAIFLALQVAGTLAQRALGYAGFYAVSVVGGVISSASAVGAAANLAASGTLPPHVAGIGAILASLMSAVVNLPLVWRLAADRRLTRRLAWTLGGVVLLGAVGVIVQTQVPAAHLSGQLAPPPSVLDHGSSARP
jgi:uncharacterized membrane protein (DUF4010 family)